MKKLGIITWYWGNYGSILQAYALQKTLSELGYDCETVCHCVNGKTFTRLKYRLKHMGIPQTFKFYFKKVYTKFYLKAKNLHISRREDIFRNFIEKNILLSRNRYNNSNFEKCSDEYDVLVCGSDQIWNPNFTFLSEFYWLGFASKNTIKVSYAPSLGVKEITTKQSVIIENFLQSFSGISVREKSSELVLKKVLGNKFDIQTVLDPTLLLEKEKWSSVSEGRSVPDNYLFAYLIRGSQKQRNYITNIAKEMKLKLVVYPFLELDSIERDEFTWGDMRVFEDSPFDFIEKIRNASLIITDSFHCSVFSIIYHKDFYVLRKANDKTSQFGRLDNLLTMFGQSERIISEYDSFNLKNVSYDGVDEILKQRRESSISFLRNAING